jgi:hypothetical protein
VRLALGVQRRLLLKHLRAPSLPALRDELHLRKRTTRPRKVRGCGREARARKRATKARSFVRFSGFETPRHVNEVRRTWLTHDDLLFVGVTIARVGPRARGGGRLASLSPPRVAESDEPTGSDGPADRGVFALTKKIPS